MPSEVAAPWTPARSAAGGRNPWLITIILSLATFMEVLDTSVANIALGHIGGDLSATYDETTWVLTSYLVANAIIVPLSGWLSDTLGRKRYYMISVALFTLSSLACAFAPSLTLLVLARIAQGLGGGGLAPCEQSMLIDTFPPEKRGQAIAAYGVVLIVGPTLGPTLGGLITDQASWRWIFLINIPVGLISLLLVWRLVTEPLLLVRERQGRRQAGNRLDIPGFALIALGLGCLQFVIDRGQQDDWFGSGLITTLAVIAAVSLATLCWWEWRSPNPVIDLRLFKHRGFAGAGAVMFATGATLYATTQIAPQFLEQAMGYTASWAGIAMTASSLATLAMTGVAAALSNRVPAWRIIGVGLVMEAIGLFHTTTITDHMGFWTMAGDRVWLVAGLPLILAPLTTGAYARLPAASTGQASAFLNLFRNIGGAAGISAAQTVLARRTAVHEQHLTDRVSGFAWRSALETLPSQFGALDQHGPLTAARATQALGRLVARQASLLAYIDVFFVFGVFTACTLPLVLLLRARRPYKESFI
jgi:DHA2 family multidrug resistance protein